MSETQRILALSHRALARGEQVCLATVVRVEGSAYRKPGARMLVTTGGERAGTISGGCLETEVSRKAWWLTAKGAHIGRYSSFADEDGSTPYGLGCGGTVSLLLEQGEPARAVLAAMERVVSTRQPAIVVTSLGQVEGESLRDLADVRAAQRRPAGTLAVLGVSSLRALEGVSVSSSPEIFDTPGPGDWEVLYLRPGSNESRSNGSISMGGSGGVTKGSFAGQAVFSLDPGLDPELEAAARVAMTHRRSCLLTSRLLPLTGEALQSNHPAEAPAYLVEYLAPPPAVTIFGAGDDAQPIAELAQTLGWRVTIADGRAHLARRDRFPQAAEVRVLDYADPALRAACGMPRETGPTGQSSAGDPQAFSNQGHAQGLQAAEALVSDEIAIILTHSYEQDRALLAALLPRRLRYLGILGPRHRTDRLLTEVAPALGFSIDEALGRLHSPIGLDLGASDPATVALSIVAEIQAVLQGRAVHVARAAEPLAFLLAGD
jgi:xanthine dehydrogenase accessory factor